MKLLFIYDAPFFKDGNLVYTNDSLPKDVWINNYLPYFNSISVIARYSNNKKTKQSLSSVDGEKVIFNLILEYSPVYSFIKTFFLNYFNVKKEIKNEIFKTDLTLVRLPSIFGFMAIPMLIKYHKPYFVEIVANAKEGCQKHGSIAGKVCAQLFDDLTKKFTSKAPFTVYVAKKLQKDYPTNGCLEVISNVIIPMIISRENIDVTRFTGKKLKIGLIGGLCVKFKGQDILLKAILELETDIKDNIELYFVGSGSYDWLIKLSKKLKLDKNIKYIGALSHDKIFDFLKTLSLYVQPSFQEGMPRSMLEAMSVGCPVLGSTIGGIPDVLRSELLHEPGDYHKLSTQIKKFYDNRDGLIKEAYNNLNLVIPFLKTNLDKKRKDFYTKIINSCPK